MISLTRNSNRLDITATFFDGRRRIYVLPYEAAVDKYGYVRAFDFRFDDGSVGHLTLLPANATRSKILDFCADYLAPLGVAIVSGELRDHKGRPVNSLIQKIFSEKTTPYVQDFLVGLSMKDAAYYDVAIGEKIILHPVQLQQM